MAIYAQQLTRLRSLVHAILDVYDRDQLKQLPKVGREALQFFESIDFVARPLPPSPAQPCLCLDVIQGAIERSEYQEEYLTGPEGTGSYRTRVDWEIQQTIIRVSDIDHDHDRPVLPDGDSVYIAIEHLLDHLRLIHKQVRTCTIEELRRLIDEARVQISRLPLSVQPRRQNYTGCLRFLAHMDELAASPRDLARARKEGFKHVAYSIGAVEEDMKEVALLADQYAAARTNPLPAKSQVQDAALAGGRKGKEWVRYDVLVAVAKVMQALGPEAKAETVQKQTRMGRQEVQVAMKCLREAGLCVADSAATSK